MKKIFTILTAAGSLANASLYAQSGYRNIENFEAGTTLVFQNCAAATFEPGKAGKNITWDFRTMSPTDTTTEWILKPAEVAGAADYPQADLVEKYSDGSYVFLKEEQDKTYLLGFLGADAKMKINYPQPVLLVQRPFAYGQTVAMPYTSSFAVNGMNFSGEGTTTIVADGTGTLILPNGTYKNVLRIKMVQQQTDKSEQYQSSNQTTITTYVWFDHAHKSALLKVSETKSQYHNEKTVAYLLQETAK